MASLRKSCHCGEQPGDPTQQALASVWSIKRRDIQRRPLLHASEGSHSEGRPFVSTLQSGIKERGRGSAETRLLSSLGTKR